MPLIRMSFPYVAGPSQVSPGGWVAPPGLAVRSRVMSGPRGRPVSSGVTVSGSPVSAASGVGPSAGAVRSGVGAAGDKPGGRHVYLARTGPGIGDC